MSTDLELARDNFLTYNPLGGAIVRQSDLASFARCSLEHFYEKRAARDPDAPQPKNLSATVFGSIVHYALMMLERLHHEGRDDALDVALATFHHYWEPENIPLLTGERIDEWLPRQTWAGLKARGKLTITDYYALLQTDSKTLLGLEYQFAVPIEVDGRTHTLTGTVDQLSIRRYDRKPYISLDDFKTGKKKTWLRWNNQGTAYAYATTRPEFWHGWEESGMGELPTFDPKTVSGLAAMFDSWGYRLHSYLPGDKPLASRKFRWINMQEVRITDGGWRTERDHARLALAVDAYVRSCEAGVYAVNTEGEICRYCSFRRTCGGVGLPPEESGRP